MSVSADMSMSIKGASLQSSFPFLLIRVHKPNSHSFIYPLSVGVFSVGFGCVLLGAWLGAYLPVCVPYQLSVSGGPRASIL